MKPRLASTLLSFAVLAGVGLAAWAQSAGPVEIAYQGRLDLNGHPANGVVDLTFQLYDAASGGSAVGSPTIRDGVSVADGAFATTIEMPPEAFVDGEVFIEIGVNGETLAGRQRIRPVPYAAGTTNSEPFLSSGQIILENQPSSDGVIDVETLGGGVTGIELRPSASSVLRVSPADLELCADGRLSAGDCAIPTRRRALVHGAGDTLTLNHSGDYTGGTTVVGPLSTGCRPGWTAISDGRLCISDALHGPDNMYDGSFANPTQGAVGFCRGTNPASHVCHETEIQQACGAGFDVFREDEGFVPSPSSLWFGDIVGDNLYVTGAIFSCDHPDSNVGPSNGINGNAYFRCCY